MNPIIGPIIGKVTDTTARILLEYENEVSVTVTVVSKYDLKELKQTQTLKSRRPTIFKFENLEPNTRYDVLVSPHQGDLISGFKTFKPDGSNEKDIKIAWISCNDQSKYSNQDNKNLWFFLAQEVQKGNYDLVCHIGDQVYLDSDYWKGNRNNVYSNVQEQIFNKYPKAEWVKYSEQIKEMIREEYRRSWTKPHTAFVLANVSNITIFDDHEIRDNWGWLPEDWNPNSDKFDYFYGKMCQIVYYEYQRQLWDDNLDLNDISKIKEEYFSLKIGKIGFFFLEIRGERTWHRTEEFDDNKMMSTKQWAKLDSTLQNEFKDIENLNLVSQGTVVFLNKEITKVVGTKVKDSQEQWVLHQDEQIRLLKKLYDWKEQKPSNEREVTIICGDVHFGGHTDIFYNNKPAFKQFTASSITNGIKERHTRIATTIALDISEIIKQKWSFNHHTWTGRNNFGYQHIYYKKTEKGEKLNTVDCCSAIVNEKEESNEPFIYKAMYNNHDFILLPLEDQCDCCSIF